MTTTERITFRLPKPAKDALEQLVEDGEYANVSDAARAAIADLTGTDARMEPNRSPPLATDGGGRET